MSTPRVITHGGVTIDLETVKCFKVQTYTEVGKSNVLTIEHKSRVDYILNPKTEEFEKQIYNDKTEVEYPNYDSACAYRDEWSEIWQDYLNETE